MSHTHALTELSHRFTHTNSLGCALDSHIYMCMCIYVINIYITGLSHSHTHALNELSHRFTHTNSLSSLVDSLIHIYTYILSRRLTYVYTHTYSLDSNIYIHIYKLDSNIYIYTHTHNFSPISISESTYIYI